jgi:hypothetical protein
MSTPISVGTPVGPDDGFTWRRRKKAVLKPPEEEVNSLDPRRLVLLSHLDTP